ncbi:MAG: oxidoreductase [Bdellovibrionales bacterium]|nr:oxidoreductase [Ramlibacter sp.]
MFHDARDGDNTLSTDLLVTEAPSASGNAVEPPFTALRVARKTALTPDIFLFELCSPDGSDLPAFTPGSHVCVQVPAGMRRNYSLSSDPSNLGRYDIAVKRDANGRGGSVSMADDVQEGDLLQVSTPRNNFELTERASDYVFVAGGIGITPILSMMRHLKATGRDRFKLYYCTRDEQSTAFLETLRAEFGAKVKFHHDRGELANACDFWDIFEKPGKAHVYCCGPRGLMDSVRDTSGHWPAGAVHFESFGVEQAHRVNLPFRVRLARSGSVVAVARDQSLLDALRGHGLRVPSSCESGTCGSCRTRLIAGDADHRDIVLSDTEKSSQIMVCVSRAAADGGELVLEL